ncbi:MAG: ATP-binding protein [Beijerinckiaceae bacterium]
MAAAERRTFVGVMSEVVATAQWLDELAARNELPGDAVFALQVCAEEILTNIVRHGGNPGPNIEVALNVSPERLELTIEDDGAPFDVTQAEPRRVSGDIATIEPGGLGVQLIHQFASALKYTRGPNGNRLQVTIELDPPAATAAARV